MLSWVERRAAATLFAAPPTATVEEALDHFLEVIYLGHGSCESINAFSLYDYCGMEVDC